MGLTIHYELHAPDVSDAEAARELIGRLREYAETLNFAECSKQVDWDHRHDDPAVGWLYRYTHCYDETPGAARFLSAAPLDLTMFVVRQPGAETAAFGLGRFESIAADMVDESIRRPTGLTGYHWNAFCKTQYASLSNHGGWANFLAIHDGICRILDHAKSLGLGVTVHDDGEYWQDRDKKKLQGKIDHWNRLIAAFTGRFKDAARGKVEGAIVAPITEDPAFERMEAEGQELIDGAEGTDN